MVKVDLDELVGELKVDIVVVGGLKSSLRFRLGLWLIRLAAVVLPTQTEVTLAEALPKARCRSGAKGKPPVAYDVGASDYDFEVGKRVRVFLDGVHLDKVSAYDAEEGWVEHWVGVNRRRSFGNVAVEWEK